MSASLPEQFCKRITLVAIAVAIPLHLIVDPAATWQLRTIAVLGFGAAFAAGRRWPVGAPAIVAGSASLVPVVLAAIVHVAALNLFYTIILTALFGTLLPRVPLDRWALPQAWRLPLAIWALTLALVWPVMIVREAGLRLGSLRDAGAIASWAQLTTPQVESWILYVVLTQLVALLFLEASWNQLAAGSGQPAANNGEPAAGSWQRAATSGERAARSGQPAEGRALPNPGIHALWIGPSLASIVAVYQGTIDMAFLSAAPWPGLRRAAGTLLDANAYGAIAALAGPLAFVSIPYLRIRHARLMQAAVLALNWTGAWMSGSRTALLCGVFGTLFMMFELLPSRRRKDTESRDTSSLLAGAMVVVLLFIVGAGAIGPLQRIAQDQQAGVSLRSLWTRGGYGTVAAQMIRDYPLTGVGAGSFNWMAPDYWRAIANDQLPFDNAQNWWRHQVAELGVVASLPVLLWSLLMAWSVFTRRTPPGNRLEAQTLRGLLIGVAGASLFGVPTQNPIVLLIFFYLVARFEFLTRPADAPARPAALPAAMRLGWAAGLVIAVGYAASHLVLARGPLKPMARAERTNRDFVIGTYPLEPSPRGQFRWTRKHATFALAVRSRYLVIRWHVEHPDVASDPVRIVITTPCEALTDEIRKDSDLNGRALEIPPGVERVMFDTDVSRTWNPSAIGRADTRDLGLAVEADFVGTPGVVASEGQWTPLKPCL